MRVASCSCHSGACSHIVAPKQCRRRGQPCTSYEIIFHNERVSRAALFTPRRNNLLCTQQKAKSTYFDFDFHYNRLPCPPSSPRCAFVTVFSRKMCRVPLFSVDYGSEHISHHPPRLSACLSACLAVCLSARLLNHATLHLTFDYNIKAA